MIRVVHGDFFYLFSYLLVPSVHQLGQYGSGSPLFIVPVNGCIRG